MNVVPPGVNRFDMVTQAGVINPLKEGPAFIAHNDNILISHPWNKLKNARVFINNSPSMIIDYFIDKSLYLAF
jgi:hypothetical protein